MFLTVLLVPQAAISFEQNMLNLKVPSTLEKHDGVFTVQHRFYGPIDEEPLDTFLGMDIGANVGLDLRYAIWPKLEVHASRIRFQKEYTLGASYALFFPSLFLRSQVGLEFFNFEKSPLTERRRNVFYQLVLQSEPIGHAITPVLNIGYDGYNERIGIGLGAYVGYEVDWGMLQHISLIGEYYPVLNEDEQLTGAEDSFAMGVQLQTYGHRFCFMVSNSTDIGVRRLMLGTDTNSPHFGFGIQRLF